MSRGVADPVPPQIDSAPAVVSAGAKAGESREFTDLNLAFHWCPAGKFMMGTPPDAPESKPVDQKQLPVTLSRGFWIGRTEVTQATWEAVMGTKPWNDIQFEFQQAQYPASNFSWHDAVEFCRRLTERERAADRLAEGWKYVIPTEAQWEYACRAGTTTRFGFGDDTARLSTYAWWGGLRGGGNAARHPRPHAVGTKLPNAWGLHDVHGNLWEFVWDDYATKSFGGGVDPVERNGGRLRVKKGGAWSYTALDCRSASRKGIDEHRCLESTGFRLACCPVVDDSTDANPVPPQS